HRVRRIDANGNITTVAGNGEQGFFGDNGPATSAGLDTPTALAFDASGNLYIADSNNHRIRKVATNGVITTFAGNGVAGYSGDNGPASAASLNHPRGVAVDSTGHVFIADTRNNVVRKVSSGTISTIAGTG